jgi:hypothetical protein
MRSARRYFRQQLLMAMSLQRMNKAEINAIAEYVSTPKEAE